MNEIKPISLPECKKSVKISKSFTAREVFRNFRTVLSRSLPLCFTGATPPRPDPSHPPSVVGAVVKRFGYQTPTVSRENRRKFKRFVQLWLKRNIQSPLTDADIPTFDEWLAQTPYPASRKLELTTIWNKLQRIPSVKRFSRVKSFVKDETYEDWKYPRLINSRVDEAKCYFGPVVQAVSDVLFSRPEFIKKIPVPDRPLYIRQLFDSSGVNSDYVYTDYTAYEAHFVPEVMKITQCLLFKHMLRGTSFAGEWYDIYERTMTGRNKLALKHFSMSIQGTRMSGEMDTSLSNGFANLMLFEYAVFCRGGKTIGVVEGDDGLFRVTPAAAAPTKEDFEKLGFTIKIEHTRELSEASFCGQVYDMTDLIVVTNPIEVISRLGWTNKKYTRCSEQTAMELLRAKGYSLVYQYYGCPMLDALGRRILQLTQGVRIKDKVLYNMDQWEREKLAAAMARNLPEPREVPENTRLLVQKLYGVSLGEQKAFEEMCSTLQLGDHALPCVNQTPKSWKDFYDQYSVDFYTNDPCWLLKSESIFLSALNRVSNCVEFVQSVS